MDDDLIRLERLRDEGLLAGQEFDAAVAKIGHEPPIGTGEPQHETPTAQVAPVEESSNQTPSQSEARTWRQRSLVLAAVAILLLIATAGLSRWGGAPSDEREQLAAEELAEAQTRATLAEWSARMDDCVSELAWWIDVFRADGMGVARVFGVESVEFEFIRDAAYQYHAESYRVGAQAAAEGVRDLMVNFCLNPALSESIRGARH